MILLGVVTFVEYNQIEIGNFYEAMPNDVQNDLTCSHNDLSEIAKKKNPIKLNENI